MCRPVPEESYGILPPWIGVGYGVIFTRAEHGPCSVVFRVPLSRGPVFGALLPRHDQEALKRGSTDGHCEIHRTRIQSTYSLPQWKHLFFVLIFKNINIINFCKFLFGLTTARSILLGSFVQFFLLISFYVSLWLSPVWLLDHKEQDDNKKGELNMTHVGSQRTGFMLKQTSKTMNVREGHPAWLHQSYFQPGHA